MTNTANLPSFIFIMHHRMGRSTETLYMQPFDPNTDICIKKRIPTRDRKKLTISMEVGKTQYQILSYDIPEGLYEERDISLEMNYEVNSATVKVSLPSPVKKKTLFQKNSEGLDQQTIELRASVPVMGLNSADSREAEITIKQYQHDVELKNNLIENKERTLTQCKDEIEKLNKEHWELKTKLENTEQASQNIIQTCATIETELKNKSNALKKEQQCNTEMKEAKANLEKQLQELGETVEKEKKMIELLKRERIALQNKVRESEGMLLRTNNLIQERKLYYPSSIHGFCIMLQQVQKLLQILEAKNLVANELLGRQLEEVLGSHSKLNNAYALLEESDSKMMEFLIGRKVDSSFLEISSQEVLEKLIIPLDFYSQSSKCTLVDRIVRICVYALNPTYGFVFRLEEKRTFKSMLDFVRSFFKLHLDIEIIYPNLLTDSYNPKDHEVLTEMSYIQRNMPDTAKSYVRTLPNGTIFDFLSCGYRFGKDWDKTKYENLEQHAKVYTLNI